VVAGGIAAGGNRSKYHKVKGIIYKDTEGDSSWLQEVEEGRKW
jgi:hypothetical protein